MLLKTEPARDLKSSEIHILLSEAPIFDFSQFLHGNISNEPTKIGDGLEEYLNHVESHPVEMVGVDSGFGYYNKMIGGGFRRKTVSLLGARQGEGKSLLALNIALHVAKSGIPVLVNSMLLQDL